MNKIALLQVGSTTIISGFTTFAAGIKQKTLSKSLADRALSFWETDFSGTWDEDLSVTPVQVSGLSVDGIIFSEVDSIADLYLQNASFFFDFTSQILYIALVDYTNFIVGDTVKLGETIGFISEAQLVEINGKNYPLNTFLGSVYYEPRLADISIVNQINDQKNGIFIFPNLEVSISNADGTHDQIKDNITGNRMELLIANISDSKEEEIETGFPFKLSAEPADFLPVRTAIVEDVDYADPNNPTIIGIDIRANWTQTIATDLLTVEEFAGLPDKFVNDRKPFLIGAINGALCIPLRADGAAASFDFFITDTQYGNIQSISAVYFKGEISGTKEDRFLTGGEYSVNLTTGIITVNNVDKGDTWVYGVFTTMTETVEIILFLLLTFDGLAFIDSNFNVSEVEAIQALDYDTQVNITGKGLQLRKVIEKLCDDIKVDMFQQGDVLTMRPANTIGISSETIPNYQIVQNPPPWSTNRTDTIKTISVGYKQDYRTKLSDTYFDNILEETALDNNRKAIDQTFDTNLTTEADIIEIYTEYYERFVEVPRVVTIDRTIPFMAGLADFITFPIIRKSVVDGTDKEIFMNAIYKIIEINEINNTVDAVFFKDERDVELIIEWDEDPVNIYEWSDDPNRLILEAN